MLPKEDRNLIAMIGRYMYYKMKDLGLPLTIEAYNKYVEEKEKEKKLKKKIGYAKFTEMKKLGMNYEEYKQYKKEQTLKKYKKKREKDKIRFRTIRYIERYCNLTMECQVCGEKAEIHHPNYNDYLKINLLCKKHHVAVHNFELVPPPIIDLQRKAVKIPPVKSKEKYIMEQMKNIKKDILEKNYTYNKLHEKYKLTPNTIKMYLQKEENWKELESKLKKAKLFSKLKHRNNLIQKYRFENGLSVQEFSNITKIPVPTIRAIESGKTTLSRIQPKTIKKLNLLLKPNNNIENSIMKFEEKCSLTHKFE